MRIEFVFWVINILGVGSTGFAQTHANGPEKNQWAEKRMEVVSHRAKAIVRIEIPMGEDREFLSTHESKTDLRLPCPTPAFGYELSDLTWSYRKWFWHGRHGSLQFRATIRSVDGNDQNLTTQATFEEWAIQDIKRYNQGVLHRSPMNMTLFQERFERVVIQEQLWLRFRRDGGGKDWFALHPIDNKYYLQVYFAFIPNRGHHYQSDWEGQASVLAEKIFQTIRVEGTPQLP